MISYEEKQVLAMLEERNKISAAFVCLQLKVSLEHAQKLINWAYYQRAMKSFRIRRGLENA